MSAEAGGTESLGVVFLHHRTDEVTANNLASFRDWNPHATIVTMGAEESFPGGYSIRDFPRFAEHWHHQISKPGMRGQSPDLLLYAWYQNRREHCDRWLVVEWDSFCAMSVEAFFALVWDFDLVAPTVPWRNRESAWYWFSTVNSLPPDLHKFAVGTSPFSFILVRDRVLEAVCQRVPWDHLGNCNCELRFATLAHACGFVPVANPLASWNITWQELPDTVPVNAGMWHPVKWLVSRQRPSVSPPGAVAWLQQGLRVPICLGNPDEQATLGTLEQFDPNVELCALLTRTGIINWLIDRNGYSSYLEIGIGDGRNFSEVNCERKVSVDPAEGEYAEASPTHRMTSDEFFASNRETFDIVFVDGLHHRDVVFRDLCNALRILNPGGAIVCHDLNPSTEAMQRVPRETNAWTGDCWKAWVQLRRERPELPMMVAKTDYGVGIIVPEAKFTAPKIDDELTWKNFDRERSTWLNLVPPGALGEVLFGDLKTEQCLAVVTLWRGEWNSVQADLLRWLVQEKFPAGTQFVWVAPEGSTTEAALEEAWAGFNACGRDYCIDLIQTPVVEIQGVVEKHHLVAALYNEALKGVRSEWVMFVEDDVVPMIGGVERLLTAMRTQPPDTAGIAAAYRLRENPKMACATDANWVYLPWPEESVTAQIEVLWAGGGFTIYRGSALRGAGTLYAESNGDRLFGGWDVNLCRTLRAQGYRIFMDMGIRADHRFATGDG